jgi:drug/metabolite transporter (DMT)-like permease
MKKTIITTPANHKSVLWGFLYSILSAISFGLIPLFSLPVMNQGMDFISVLIYRFAFSCLFILPILIIGTKKLKITIGEIWRLMLLALLYCGSALFLFWSYLFMSSGKATTIHFMYPVFTSIIMMLFFREKFSIKTIAAITIAVSGVACLANENNADSRFALAGLLIVLFSGICYAIYLVAVNQLKVRSMGSLKLTFYVTLFGLFILIIVAETFGQGIQHIHNLYSGIHLILLALIPTVVSNITLILAIKRLGSTRTAVMGAFEPLTAVCVGVLFLGEQLTFSSVLGIIFIIMAITILILSHH